MGQSHNGSYRHHHRHHHRYRYPSRHQFPGLRATAYSTYSRNYFSSTIDKGDGFLCKHDREAGFEEMFERIPLQIVLASLQ